MVHISVKFTIWILFHLYCTQKKIGASCACVRKCYKWACVRTHENRYASTSFRAREIEREGSILASQVTPIPSPPFNGFSRTVLAYAGSLVTLAYAPTKCRPHLHGTPLYLRAVRGLLKLIYKTHLFISKHNLSKEIINKAKRLINQFSWNFVWKKKYLGSPTKA